MPFGLSFVALSELTCVVHSDATLLSFVKFDEFGLSFAALSELSLVVHRDATLWSLVK